MRASNPETIIYFAGSGDWTQARLITVSASARTVPMSHRDKHYVPKTSCNRSNWHLFENYFGIYYSRGHSNKAAIVVGRLHNAEQWIAVFVQSVIGDNHQAECSGSLDW